MWGRRVTAAVGGALALVGSGCGGDGDPLGGAPDVRGVRVGEAYRILEAAGLTDISACDTPDADRALARQFLFVSDQRVVEVEGGRRITVLVLGATPTSPGPRECRFPYTGDLH